MLCENFLGEMKSLGHKDNVGKSQWPTVMAQIMLTVDIYLQREQGLYGTVLSPRRAVDLINVMAVEQKLNEDAVAALTLGLSFEDIFEFYREIELLLKQCPSGTAWPYPLTGFKSPTIFICKDTCAECDHRQHSGHAVNLIQPLRDLPIGEYRRCLLLTPKLVKFYKDHYDEIKEETAEQSKSGD